MSSCRQHENLCQKAEWKASHNFEPGVKAQSASKQLQINNRFKPHSSQSSEPQTANQLNEVRIEMGVRSVLVNGCVRSIENNLKASNCIMLRHERSEARRRKRRCQINQARSPLSQVYSISEDAAACLADSNCDEENSQSWWPTFQQRLRRSARYIEPVYYTDRLYVSLYEYFQNEYLNSGMTTDVATLIQVQLDRLGEGFPIPPSPTLTTLEDSLQGVFADALAGQRWVDKYMTTNMDELNEDTFSLFTDSDSDSDDNDADGGVQIDRFGTSEPKDSTSEAALHIAVSAVHRASETPMSMTTSDLSLHRFPPPGLTVPVSVAIDRFTAVHDAVQFHKIQRAYDDYYDQVMLHAAELRRTIYDIARDCSETRSPDTSSVHLPLHNLAHMSRSIERLVDDILHALREMKMLSATASNF